MWGPGFELQHWKEKSGPIFDKSFLNFIISIFAWPNKMWGSQDLQSLQQNGEARCWNIQGTYTTADVKGNSISLLIMKVNFIYDYLDIIIFYRKYFSDNLNNIIYSNKHGHICYLWVISYIHNLQELLCFFSNLLSTSAKTTGSISKTIDLIAYSTQL